MEANKPEAERVRDMGVEALRAGNLPRAIKMLSKSLQLYPLNGVESLLEQAKQQQNRSSSSNSNGNPATRTSPAPTPSATSNGTASAAGGGGTNAASGRAYTEENVKIVKKILTSKEGGRGAHYRVLGIASNANEADIKKAYRKLALKLHPDKNGAPHADEAFKAVGLAYATLSDGQKRTIYDRYGDEDPDNRGGGGGGANMARHFQRGGGGGRDPTPEEIFNMFFGGGVPGGGMRAGGPGVHFYTNGFGFGGGMPQRGFRGGRPQGGREQQQPEQAAGFGNWFQLLPLFVVILMSFFGTRESTGGYGGGSAGMPGNNKYYSLVHKPPFSNPLKTKLTGVKDIPYYVTDKFLRTYHRDRYQLSQVERMVEQAYEEYLVEECTSQEKYKLSLVREANGNKEDARLHQRARSFELSRCQELDELFPRRSRQRNDQKQKRKR